MYALISGSTTIAYVECYDADSNEWYDASPMNMNRSALSACVLAGLPNTREYSYLSKVQDVGQGASSDTASHWHKGYNYATLFWLGLSCACTATQSQKLVGFFLKCSLHVGKYRSPHGEVTSVHLAIGPDHAENATICGWWSLVQDHGDRSWAQSVHFALKLSLRNTGS